MKTLFLLLTLSFAPLCIAQDKVETPKIDVLAIKDLPGVRYSVPLELKQLDGKAMVVELHYENGVLKSVGDTGKLGQIQGRLMLLGNGVFMVQLKGDGYLATQWWVFQPDGTAQIKEVPDRGEKQIARPIEEKQ